MNETSEHLVKSVAIINVQTDTRATLNKYSTSYHHGTEEYVPKTALPGAGYIAVFEALVLVGVVPGIDY